MSDFEQLSEKKGASYSYDPHKNKAVNPMEGKSGENLTGYYGPVLAPQTIDEIRMWAEVLSAVKDGLPKPFDNSIIIDKIIKLEKKTGNDLTELKKCCPPSADIREAKEFKPLIFGIVDRIIEISGIQKYVSKYG